MTYRAASSAVENGSVNVEIEAKLRVESHDPIRKHIDAAGAQYLGKVLETNEIFDSVDGSLRRRGCGLRVRATVDERTGGRAVTMTFKGPVMSGAFKSREEQEVDVNDADTVSRILTGLGFVRILWFEKRRESWHLDDCRIELDEPPHIGLFVEIEGPDERTIAAVQSKLGLEGVAHEPASYVRMLSLYCDHNGVVDRVLRLDPCDPTS